MATNECITELEHICYQAQDLGMADANERTTVYNDNEACINWSASVTNIGTKHISLRENYIREAHHLGIVRITQSLAPLTPAISSQNN